MPYWSRKKKVYFDFNDFYFFPKIFAVWYFELHRESSTKSPMSSTKEKWTGLVTTPSPNWYESPGGFKQTLRGSLIKLMTFIKINALDDILQMWEHSARITHSSSNNNVWDARREIFNTSFSDWLKQALHEQLFLVEHDFSLNANWHLHTFEEWVDKNSGFYSFLRFCFVLLLFCFYLLAWKATSWKTNKMVWHTYLGRNCE